MRKLSYFDAFLSAVVILALLWFLFPSANTLEKLRQVEVKKPELRDIIKGLDNLDNSFIPLAKDYLKESDEQILIDAIIRFYKNNQDYQNQLTWLLISEEKQSDPQYKDEIVALYLKDNDKKKAITFLKQSYLRYQDIKDLDYLANLGEYRPLIDYLSSDLTNLSLAKRKSLFQLFLKAKDSKGAINSLFPYEAKLWSDPEIINQLYLLIEQDTKLTKVAFPILADNYLKKADSRLLELVINNLNLLPKPIHYLWQKEVALMLGYHDYILALIDTLGASENLAQLNELAEELLFEINRQPQSNLTDLLITASNLQSDPRPDFPLNQSERFIRAGCETKLAFCLNDQRTKLILEKALIEKITFYREKLDLNLKIAKILSQNPTHISTEDLYLVLNRQKLTLENYAFIYELAKRENIASLKEELISFFIEYQEEADLVLSKLVDSNKIDLLKQSINILNFKKEYHLVAKLYSLLLKYEKNNLKAYEYLAYYYKQINNLELQLDNVKQAVNLDTQDPYLIILAANENAKPELYQKACSLFKLTNENEMVLALEACQKAKNHQKAALILESLMLAKPNQHYKEMWLLELAKAKNYNFIAKYILATDLTKSSQAELNFLSNLNEDLNNQLALNKLKDEILKRETKTEIEAPIWVIDEIKEEKAIQKIVLAIPENEVLAVEKEAEIYLALRREKEIILKEAAIKKELKNNLFIGFKADNYAGKEDFYYTVENYDWEALSLGLGHNFKAFSIGRDFKLSYKENFVRGYKIGLKENLAIQEVALNFAKQIKDDLKIKVELAKTRHKNNQGFVEKASSSNIIVRKELKHNYFTEISLYTKNQSYFDQSKTGLFMRNEDRLDLLFGRLFELKAGLLEVALGASLDGSIKKPLIKTRFENQDNLGIYYNSSYDPWLKKVLSEYGVDYRISF